MDLPQDVKEVLQSILAKNPEDLTEYEVAFLNARRDYLNNEQKRIFASVLKDSQILHEEATVKQQEQAPTQYTDEAGQPVTQEVQPQEENNIVTPQVQTPVRDVEQIQPAAPTEHTEAHAFEAGEQPEQPQETAPLNPEPVVNENPYDVNIAEKDSDVA